MLKVESIDKHDWQVPDTSSYGCQANQAITGIYMYFRSPTDVRQVKL